MESTNFNLWTWELNVFNFLPLLMLFATYSYNLQISSTINVIVTYNYNVSFYNIFFNDDSHYGPILNKKGTN